MADSLKAIYTDIEKDKAFRSLRNGMNFVPGVGSQMPALIIVGEAPGQKEDEQSKPFVGPSGKMLDKLLAVGVTPYMPKEQQARECIWVTNVIKYRPVDEKGKNRTPTEAEVDAARPYLKRELAIIGQRRGEGPRPIICLMGKTAGLLLGKKHGLTRGEVTTIKGWRFAYLYHPAVALYDPTMKAELIEHFKVVCKSI